MNKILRNWSAEHDLPDQEFPDQTYVWGWPKHITRVKAMMRKSHAMEAQTYINYIIKQYPVQLRPMLGYALWEEFCQYYAVNPDFDKAIRTI